MFFSCSRNHIGKLEITDRRKEKGQESRRQAIEGRRRKSGAARTSRKKRGVAWKLEFGRAFSVRFLDEISLSFHAEVSKMHARGDLGKNVEEEWIHWGGSEGERCAASTSPSRRFVFIFFHRAELARFSTLLSPSLARAPQPALKTTHL